jgi:hypothetical protein
LQGAQKPNRPKAVWLSKQLGSDPNSDWDLTPILLQKTDHQADPQPFKPQPIKPFWVLQTTKPPVGGLAEKNWDLTQFKKNRDLTPINDPN